MDFVNSDACDYNDDRTHNDVNELTARDTDDNGTDDFTLTCFKNGALKNDGENYKYVWDAWGRLRQVKNRSNDALVAEYRYNGLGFRITEYVEASTTTHHMVYDDSWRIVATYREDDADPKDVYVYHNAGDSGYGSSSYIDAVILRDLDTDFDWDEEPEIEESLQLLDTRHYYCQNWRADVSVIIDDSAVLVERIMYSPYGVPFGIPVGDLVSSSFAEPADGTTGSADNSALLGTYWGSSYNIADLDNDGDVDSADQTILLGNWGATLGWGALSLNHNRLGYAGYVFDDALAGTKWHVRHRVLESVLGRWVSRDPWGYIDSVSLLIYASNHPISYVDPSGLIIIFSTPVVAPRPIVTLPRLIEPVIIPRPVVAPRPVAPVITPRPIVIPKPGPIAITPYTPYAPPYTIPVSEPYAIPDEISEPLPYAERGVQAGQYPSNPDPNCKKGKNPCGHLVKVYKQLEGELQQVDPFDAIDCEEAIFNYRKMTDLWRHRWWSDHCHNEHGLSYGNHFQATQDAANRRRKFYEAMRNICNKQLNKIKTLRDKQIRSSPYFTSIG